MVAVTIIGIPDVDVQSRVAENLYSEFGCGRAERSHIRLLGDFLIDLLSRLAGRVFTLRELLQLPVLPSTSDFSAAQRALYTADRPCCVLGAHLAQEWLAYSMLAKLYEGARRYRGLYPSIEAFHAHCEYFHAHIGETEKSHRHEAAQAARSVCKTEHDWAELALAVDRFLEITASFWKGLASALPSLAVR